MTPDIIDQLAEAIARHTARRIPLAVDYWSAAEIAAAFKVSAAHVREVFAVDPKFPQAIGLAGHKSADMTSVYRDVRGDEWVKVS